MDRQWTDRDGRRWTVSRVQGTGRGGDTPGSSDEDAAGLEFRSGDRIFTTPSQRVGEDLDALEDGELQDLLDQAVEGGPEPDEDLRDAGGEEGESPTRRGPGVASPDASGRESGPHADPGKEGPATSD